MKRNGHFILLFLALNVFFSPTLLASESLRLDLTLPPIVLKDIPFEIKAQAVNAEGEKILFDGRVTVEGFSTKSGEIPLLRAGELTISDAIIDQSGKKTLTVQVGDLRGEASRRVIPGVLSLLPPILAILLALVSRQVILSLFAGIWLGTFLLYDFAIVRSFFAVLDHYLVNSLADKDHASVLLFTLTFGGMVALIYKNGGTHGIVDWLSKHADNSRKGQVAAWFLGVFIFFDDYANTLIVGNTMRPLTDRLKISREKLAFIVDATAAPVASVALISSWIGTEVGLIGDAISHLPIEGDAYSYFLSSIPYRFYPLLMLVFGFAVAFTGRDLFSMAKAEKRAFQTGKLFRDGAEIPYDVAENQAMVPKDSTPRRPLNAIVPVAVLILVTLAGLWITGASAYDKSAGFFENMRGVVGSANSYQALLWSSLAGTSVAILMSVSQKILTLTECFDTFVNGLKSMMLACAILVMAWAIGSITKDVATNHYLTAILSETLSPRLLPVLVFITAGLVSFSTGTSWGTMAILMPIVVPLSYYLSKDAGLDAQNMHIILVGSISSVLAGAVWGDHCSPISDTTVLSSLASGCDHIDHVRTQFPYALLVAGIGMALGDIPTAYGMSPWISLLLGSFVIVMIVRFLGKRIDSQSFAD